MAKHIYCRHSTEMEIPFFDIDAMSIVWHGHYVKYLEVARCDFLSAIGYDYMTMKAAGYVWPVVQMQLKYVRPARFGQKIRVDVAVTEIDSCLRLDYTILDAASGAKLTRATTTQAVVRSEDGEMQYQTPPCWLAAVRRHPTFRQPD